MSAIPKKSIICARQLENLIAEKCIDIDNYSIVRLAHLFDVSSTTMGEAIRILSNKGILECSPGKRMKLKQRREVGTQGSRDAADKLCDRIKKRIRNGTYSVDSPLPKFEYFLISQRVSPNTVSTAFHRLHAEGYIHKRGKTWYAGAPDFAAQKTRVAFNRSVLLLAHFDLTWHKLFLFSHTRPFFHSLTVELNRFSITMALGVLEATGLVLSHLIPIGREKIEKSIEEMGEGFSGMVLALTQPIKADLEKWIISLSRLNKPVIIYDFADEYQLFRAHYRRHEHLYRCHLDELAAVNIAIDELAKQGHVRVGLPVPDTDGGRWLSRRVELILQQAAARAPGMIVITKTVNNAYWDHFSTTSIDSFLHRISSDPSDAASDRTITSSREVLLRNAPEFADLLLKEKVTALICLNDGMARKYYVWLHAAGIQVPEEISLISFDNMLETHPFPISSVDFGFSSLGYQAAHMLIGDIPYALQSRDIPGECKLFDRKSVSVLRQQPGVS